MEHTYDAATNAMTAIDVKRSLQIATANVAAGGKAAVRLTIVGRRAPETVIP
jgi:hypothetical protein